MANYLDVPTLSVDFLKPRRMQFSAPGGGIDGARNGLGYGSTIEMTGGGIVTGSYEDCVVADSEEHEYTNWLDALLSGSFRFINVPILTDKMGLFPLIGGVSTPIVGGVSHSDGALFSDGSGYSQATVYGEITATAALNAGTISMSVTGAARALRWSDWFAIKHTTKGWRAYRYWKVISGSFENPTYSLAISPPLREATPAGTRVEFARPLCVMKFPSGFSSPWVLEDYWMGRPSFQFVEAF